MALKKNNARIQLPSPIRVAIPDDLAAVTQIGAECDPEIAGMKPKQVAALWKNIEALYKTGVYPGIGFCLRRHGSIVLNRVIGHRQGNGPHDTAATPKLPMQLDTPICLFSASKAVTAMVIHGLAEQGLINLFDPVSYYLPGFAVKGKQDLTIQQVLSHRAGIPTLPKNFDIDILFDADALSHFVDHLKPQWASGRALGYHAITGGFVLGKVAETVTGTSMRQLLHDQIQQPMGMKYFNYGLPTKFRSRRAFNYTTGLPAQFPVAQLFKRLLGLPVEQVTELSNDIRFQQAIMPPANLMATAEETSRFFQMLLDEGRYKNKRIYAAETIRNAIKPFGKPEMDRMFFMPMHYSAGMMLGGSPVGLWGPNSESAFGHIGFSNNLCWADRQRDISVAFLTTGNPILGPHLLKLIKLISLIGFYCKPVIPK